MAKNDSESNKISRAQYEHAISVLLGEPANFQKKPNEKLVQLKYAKNNYQVMVAKLYADELLYGLIQQKRLAEVSLIKTLGGGWNLSESK